MVKSIDAVLSRGERIEILVDRTDEMSHQARAFRKRATVVRRKMWFKNVKVLFAVGFSAVVRRSRFCRSCLDADSGLAAAPRLPALGVGLRCRPESLPFLTASSAAPIASTV